MCVLPLCFLLLFVIVVFSPFKFWKNNKKITVRYSNDCRACFHTMYDKDSRLMNKLSIPMLNQHIFVPSLFLLKLLFCPVYVFVCMSEYVGSFFVWCSPKIAVAFCLLLSQLVSFTQQWFFLCFVLVPVAFGSVRSQSLLVWSRL